MMTWKATLLIVMAGLAATPAGATSAWLETTSMALSVVDEVVIAGLIVGACVLIDRASWSVLTGQKNPGIKPISGRRVRNSGLSQRPAR